jgi:PIN domain nuclease of toxin-antitoxin system
MKLLLDTHVFIWWAGDPARLSARAMTLLRDTQNTLVLSVGSVWEMAIKIQLGKLRLGLPLEAILATQRQGNELQILPVALEHVLAVEHLPSIHKDPFDRLLVAQARVEDMLLVSSDPTVARYPCRTVW